MIFGIIFNKFRNELSKKSFLICAFLFLIGFILYSKTSTMIKSPTAESISAVVAPNGKVILKSFQKSIIGFSKTSNSDRSPAGVGVLVKKTVSNTGRSADSAKNGNEFNIKINGTSVYLLKNYVAVKTKSPGINADIPVGFELRREKITKINRIHDSEKLLVFLKKLILVHYFVISYSDIN